MSDDETTPEMLARLGTDAMLWAQEFNKTAVKLGYSEMDEGWLIGWFANAIENCDVIRCNQLRAELDALGAYLRREAKYRGIAEFQAETAEADLAAVTAERDRMREAIKDLLAHVETLECRLDYHDREMCEDVELKDRARAALEGVKEPASLWQHKKTGGIYEVVGECQIESTNTPGVLYRNTSTGVTWVRPKEEFFDGRFVEWRKSEPPNLPR